MPGWWVSDIWTLNPVLLISWIVWVVVSITLHELGHGIVAIRLGDDTPVVLGRMTLNPLVHIPRAAWLMFVVFGFTWGFMPVNPRNLRGRYGDVLVSLAGPAVNLLLAGASLLLLGLWARQARTATMSPELEANVATFFYTGAAINICGFLFNLIPCPPLDGAHVVAGLFPRVRALARASEAKWVLVAGAIGLYYVSGRVWEYVFEWTDIAADFVVRLIA